MLNIACALQCEARPLIDKFKLKVVSNLTLFPLYSNETMRLVISGIGKINAASAAAYLIGCYSGKCIPGWLNIGVGGHHTEAIGEGFLVNKIIDRGTGNRYYPGIALMPSIPTLPVETVDSPEKNYPKESIVDMEASGFFHAASRLSPAEVIHCYKVISDNIHNPAEKFDKKFVTDLIANRMEDISFLIEKLMKLLKGLNQQPHCDPEAEWFLSEHRFTQTEKVMLGNLLQRWRAVKGGNPIRDNAMKDLKSAKELLMYMERKINSQPLVF